MEERIGLLDKQSSCEVASFRLGNSDVFIKNGAIGVFRFANDGRLTEANDALRQTLGYWDTGFPSVVNLADWFATIEDRHRWLEIIQHGKSLRGFEAQWRQRRDPGGTIWVRIDAEPAFDADGRVISYSGTVANINSLRVELEGLRSLLSDAPIGCHEIDTQGRITYINRAELEMLGWSQEDAIGQPVWCFVRERERGISEQAVRAKLAGKRPPGHAFFRTYLKKDNVTTIPMLFDDRLLLDDHGGIIGIRTTCADMSVGPFLEQWLRNPEIGLSEIWETLPVCIFRKDRNGRFTYANSRFCREGIRRTLEDVVGRADLECDYPPEQVEQFLEDDEIVFNTGRMIEMIERYASPHATERYWIQVVKSPIYDVDGQIVEVQGVYWRVTDRKQVVEQLIKGNLVLAKRLNLVQEKYRRIWESETVGIYTSTTDGEYMDGNPALSRMYGYASLEAMLNDARGARRTRSEEGERKHASDFLRIIEREGRVSGWEHEIRRRDGASVWISESAWAVRDRSGRVCFHEGVVKDITARKLSQERERRVFANACDIIYTHEFSRSAPLEARFTKVNGNAVKRILGYTEQEFCQKRLKDIIADEYHAEVARIITTRQTEKTSRLFSVEAYHKEKHRVLLEINATLRKGISGKLEVLGVGRDATEHQLRDVESKLVVALRNAVGLDRPEALAIAVRRVLCAFTTSDGLKAHRAIFFERNGEQLNGLCAVGPTDAQQASDYSTGVASGNITFGIAMMGMDSPDFRHPDELHFEIVSTVLSLSSFGEPARRLIREGRSGVLDLRFGAQNEVKEFLEEHDIGKVLLKPVEGGGGVAAVLILDYLYQGREHELPAQREVARFARYLPELLAQRSYIRNQEYMLVHGIHHLGLQAQAYSEALGQEGVGDAGKRAIKGLQLINSQMQATVEKMLSLSKRRVEPGSVDVNLVIAKAKDFNNDIKMDIRGLDRLSPRARCDEEQLWTILNELLENARKWKKPQQTCVEITVITDIHVFPEKLRNLQVVAGQKYVRIIVSDNGRGISPKVRERIFDLYVRDESVPGNGLGLAAARWVLSMQHGEIAETSLPGEGAKFEIFLPTVQK